MTTATRCDDDREEKARYDNLRQRDREEGDADEGFMRTVLGPTRMEGRSDDEATTQTMPTTTKNVAPTTVLTTKR